MGCHDRIDRAVAGAVRIPLGRCSRYVIFSDCHRGQGTSNDNFLKNQHLYKAALDYYLRNCFFYLELGDGEELWENRCVRRIRDYYEEVYGLLGRFDRQNRLIRIYGNHDMALRCALPEAVVLENREGGRDVYMIHGHQADFFNSVCWKLSRFLVRYLWKPLEGFGVNDPTSAARNNKKTEKYEQCMVSWTVKHQAYLVAGHSHRPRLRQPGDWYLNAGSCVHPGGVTCIEIENMNFTLVRWAVQTRPDMIMYVEREVLAGPVAIR